MAQGLGAKAKKVFKDITKQPEEDDDDDSSSSEDSYGDEFLFSSDDSGDVDSQFGLEHGFPVDADDFEKLPVEMRNEAYAAITEKFNKENVHLVVKKGAEAYTKWLDDNKNSLEQKEKQRHQEACELYKEMDNIYDNEGEDASDEIKLQNSVKIYSMMMKAVQYGTPPASVAQAMGNTGSGITSRESYSNLLINDDDEPKGCAIS